MRSIVEDADCCFICATIYGKYNWQEIENHHIFFGTGKRSLSDEDGLTVHLCRSHHREGPEAAHKNRLTDMYLKAIGQSKYEETHTRAEFIKRYGKSYL